MPSCLTGGDWADNLACARTAHFVDEPPAVATHHGTGMALARVALGHREQQGEAAAAPTQCTALVCTVGNARN